MITKLHNIQGRDTAVLYGSILDQLRAFYNISPEKGGEFAISAIEMLLTGEISSSDEYIRAALLSAKAISARDAQKYEAKRKASREKQMRDLSLQRIAELYMQSIPQSQIAAILANEGFLGMSQQTISYRIGLIKSDFPELLIADSYTNDT